MKFLFGLQVPNVDLPPLCSSRFRAGPPGEQAQAASQFIADVIERYNSRKTFLCGLKQRDWLSKKRKNVFLINFSMPANNVGQAKTLSLLLLLNSCLFSSALQFRFNKYGGIVH